MHRRYRARRGIIPAYAGSTAVQKLGKPGSSDHPRIRGEHRGGASGTEDIPGSSPHTRGAPPTTPRGTKRSWIIPAYAGSTFREVGTLIFDEGSSPHTRGALRRTGPGRWVHRIIPAYAGSTGNSPPAAARKSDHPRIRGEHFARVDELVAEPGSSPHTRGARVQVGILRVAGGIIPAYAGSTGSLLPRSAFPEDHPRIRGEHIVPTSRRRVSVWIIPAYAGSTSRAR